MATLGEIAGILQTTEKNLSARVLRMKLGDCCGRCGGSGNYSYNQMDGTRCFGCAGAGNVMPKEAGLGALKARAVVARRRSLNSGRVLRFAINGEEV